MLKLLLKIVVFQIHVPKSKEKERCLCICLMPAAVSGLLQFEKSLKKLITFSNCSIVRQQITSYEVKVK